MSPTEVAAALGDLQALFADAEPATRHRIVQALFEQVEVLGPDEVWLYPSVEAEARGWAAAMSGEFRVELRQSGRGERASASLTQQSLRFLMINRTLRESPPGGRHEAHEGRAHARRTTAVPRPPARWTFSPPTSPLADPSRTPPRSWASARAP